MSVEIRREDLETWADYLLDWSIGGVEPEDVVMVKGERIAWPLMSVLQDKIFARGAIADICLVPPDNDRGKVWGASIAHHGTVDQISRVPAWQQQRYEAMTKYIEVMGAESPELFGGLPDETATAVMRADELYKGIRLLKPWVITLYPTKGFADLEEMSLEEYTDVIVSASTVDPRLLDDVEEPLRIAMERSQTIRIVTEHPRTGKMLELSMDIGGQNIIKCTGTRNLPDGEVYTSPDSRSTEGEIFVDLPVFQGGETIQGIFLRFQGGVIQEYSAEVGHEALAKVIETDAGSRRLGEVALGVNTGIEKVLRHPLFVEKVGGTLHIAIGASYPEAYISDPGSPEGRARTAELAKLGSLNQSAQHVDIVTDFRPGGSGRAVYLDNEKLEVVGNTWKI
ncbi:MAG: aminopeptidase [Acidobacteriota bacterium]|nr:MAG: aminopeptidase [Acidobacteriota bacterium]